MPPKVKKVVDPIADAARRDAIRQILTEASPDLLSSDDDDEETIEEVKEAAPHSVQSLRSFVSTPLKQKRERSEAQIASLARAQSAAQVKRKVRDKQREADKVAGIAQEVARILGERQNEQEIEYEPRPRRERQQELEYERERQQEMRYERQDRKRSPVRQLRAPMCNPFD